MLLYYMRYCKSLIVVLIFSLISIVSFPQTIAKEKKTDYYDQPIENNEQFVNQIFKCVKNFYSDYKRYPLERQVPFDLVVAMAAYESAWGQSRFAKEGNNYFGIRTWDLDNVPHMKAKKRPDAPWGVKKYSNMCLCIEDYIQILNNHPAYEEFRNARAWEINLYGYTNATTLSQFLVSWSELGEKYTSRLRQIILLIHKQGYYQKLPVDIRGQITHNFE